MRHNSQGRRPRHRGGNGGQRHSGSNRGGGNNRAQVFDSNGPEVRIRGTAYQIFEKYQTLAKDAASMGDRVLEESYLQHAEHYQRIIGQWADAMPARSDAEHKPEEQKVKPEITAEKVADGTDMGLPASITGKKQAEKSKATLEDA